MIMPLSLVCSHCLINRLYRETEAGGGVNEVITNPIRGIMRSEKLLRLYARAAEEFGMCPSHVEEVSKEIFKRSIIELSDHELDIIFEEMDAVLSEEKSNGCL